MSDLVVITTCGSRDRGILTPLTRVIDSVMLAGKVSGISGNGRLLQSLEWDNSIVGPRVQELVGKVAKMRGRELRSQQISMVGPA